MIRIHLCDTEVQRLAQVFRTTPDTTLRHRVHIVLMAPRGRHHPAIAPDTGTSQRSVQRWLNVSLARGSLGLQPRKAKGPPPRSPPTWPPSSASGCATAPLPAGWSGRTGPTRSWPTIW